MGPLLVAGLIGATVLYLYDLYVTGPAAARVFIAHLPALGYFILLGYGDDWPKMVSSYAAVPISLGIVLGLQYLLIKRDAVLANLGRRR